MTKKEWLKDIAAARREIVKRCGPKSGDGWLNLTVPAHEVRDYENGDRKKDYKVKVPEKTYRVPKLPFLAWCVERTTGKHLIEWEPVSRSGWKMQLDSVAHTDWLIGAGFGPDDEVWGTFTHPLMDAAYDLRGKMLEELLGFQVNVLSDGGYVDGLVQHAKPNESLKPITRVPSGISNIEDDGKMYRRWDAIERVLKVIAVIPEPTPEYVPAMLSADAIILARGGPAAHLVKVGMEAQKTIVVIPDAVTKFPPGTRLDINPKEGKIEIDTFDRGTDYYWYFQGDWVPEGQPTPREAR